MKKTLALGAVLLALFAATSKKKGNTSIIYIYEIPPIDNTGKTPAGDNNDNLPV